MEGVTVHLGSLESCENPFTWLNLEWKVPSQQGENFWKPETKQGFSSDTFLLFFFTVKVISKANNLIFLSYYMNLRNDDR